MASAQGDLDRFNQQLKYNLKQRVQGQLSMPFDGYIVDSFLKTKRGSYIQEGGTFASVQESQKKLVSLQVPEYDASFITVGSRVEIKL